MTQDNLEQIMVRMIIPFNDENARVSVDTIHKEVLSDSDGFGPANSKNAYRMGVGRFLWKYKVKQKTWPRNWMDISIRELASKLIIFLMMLLPFAGQSQLQVEVGAGKTELRDNAITIAVAYIKSFDSLFKNNDFLWHKGNTSFMIAPEITFRTGTEDAFSSVNLKATGLFLKYKTTMYEGYEITDFSKTFHAFPIAFGVETNNLFNTMNGIVEAGYVPWYQNAAKSTVIKRTKVGFFIQAGHKFFIDSSGKSAVGGEVDQSEEEVKRTIFRAKGSFAIDSKTILRINNLDVGLVGSADVWYDFINSATYYRIDGRGRFFLDKERYIDIIYQKGSGAPNFNTGDQFGVGLTITF